MKLPKTLTFVPGYKPKDTSIIEVLPRIELPSGDALLLQNYTANYQGGDGTPNLEERNFIGAEIVNRWNGYKRNRLNPSIDPESLPKGVSIIPYREGKFAVSRRLSKIGNAGLWQFPGGHVEPGEPTLDAAMRELREETGLDLKSHRFFYIGKAGPLIGYKGEVYMGYRYGVALCDHEEPQRMEPEKHTAWQWVTHRELLDLEMLQATVPFALSYAITAETGL